MKQGKKYYDHRLTQLEKTKLIDLINQPAKDFTTVGNASLPPYFAGKDTKLFSILQTNCSKIVDDQGKPLVVEHGTHAEFTTFDISKFGETSKDEGLFGAGFYFGTHAPAWLNDGSEDYRTIFVHVRHIVAHGLVVWNTPDYIRESIGNETIMQRRSV